MRISLQMMHPSFPQQAPQLTYCQSTTVPNYATAIPSPSFPHEHIQQQQQQQTHHIRYGGLSGTPPPTSNHFMNASPDLRRYSLPNDHEFVPQHRITPSGTPRQQRRPVFMHSPIVSTSRSHSNKRTKKQQSTYSRWTLEEDELLRQAVAVYGAHKWSLVASHVPNRSPMQCSTRWLGALNPNIHKGRWTEYEDAILKYSVMEYANYKDQEGRIQPIPWNKIAERIPNRTGIQCQARWTEALDPYVRKGKWSAEEDALLRAGVAEHGRCWIRIAETIPGRTQRQCRTRWMQMKFREERQQQAEETGSLPAPSAAAPVTEAEPSFSTASNCSVDDGSSVSCASTEEDQQIDFSVGFAGLAVAATATAPNTAVPMVASPTKPQHFIWDNFDFESSMRNANHGDFLKQEDEILRHCSRAIR
ncbi:Myb-like DNA-binding domain protein [Apophysomyces ossiformis]|uniref:Myb-like DNA-binding domain protein n=1 Tax=Apophysomyces ossiformis TaxID=679940 RepID=A0A8H7BW39_9FUNG|nr:Myb-like DNA-binding domain protein [Apophysomyces ossiformis]